MKTILVIISANAEWRVVRAFYPHAAVENTPFGEFLELELAGNRVVMLQGGWGKISAAASAQYGISHWGPDLVLNLGTCGGFEGRIQRGTIILVEKTIVYDIFEQMGDAAEALEFYSTSLDLSFIRKPYPQAVQKGLLVSADRDIIPADIPGLVEKYAAVAADWESGAIAWVCARTQRPCLILRAVTDLVSIQGGEAYGTLAFFQQATQEVISAMFAALPGWIKCALPAE
ncbi:MAG: hypothetical protein CVU39_24835 [Chloroflexi bacterium HGW-Chloroflexi-10]|nr:MAG: hypothetical protein CVU39_24835 [Chloroflexi bacterium HGW-Chloroflexi-10]